MNKRFSYILICLLMLGILLAPVSPLLENGVVEAQTVTTTPPTTTQAQLPDTTNSALYNSIGDCGIGLVDGNIKGCFVVILYWMFVSLPSFLMGLAATFFDFMAGLTISSSMYGQLFIPTIWKIVRDFANIFFILILLYAAFSTILGLGHGGGKKIVAAVIITALLINFSLFLSKVIIDSSNILALIFYNKIACTQKDGNPCQYIPTANASKTGVPEKPLSLALTSRFDINNFYTGDFLKGLPTATSTPLTGQVVGALSLGALSGVFDDTHIEPGVAVVLIVTYGMVAFSLAWTFFIVGLSFLGRMIMLMLLMIVSPLAFATASVPGFRKVDTIGFESWIHKLIETGFSASIFMALLYLVAQVMQADIFKTNSLPDSTLGVVQRLLLIFIPALLITVLLTKGRKYVQKASGEFTGAVISGAKILGGLALGGVALGAAGAAAAGRNTLGSVAKYTQNTSARQRDSLKNFSNWSFGKKINPLSYGKAVSAGLSKQLDSRFARFGGKTVGERMRNSDRGYSEKTHSLATLNDKTKSEFAHQYGNEVKYKDLTEAEQNIVKKEIDKDEMAKFTYGKKFKDLEATESARIQSLYNNGQRAISDNTGHAVRIGAMGTVNTPGGEKIRSDAIADFAKLKTPVGEFVQALRKGSYDIRDVSKAPALVKTPLGVIGGAAALFGAPLVGGGMLAGLAGGIRTGLKRGASEYGNVNKDIFKDLGDVVAGALKNVKIKVDTGKDKGHGGGEVKSVGH